MRGDALIRRVLAFGFGIAVMDLTKGAEISVCMGSEVRVTKGIAISPLSFTSGSDQQALIVAACPRPARLYRRPC